MCANSAWQHLLLLGWHCGFSPLSFVVACDWSDLSVIPCSCGFICSPSAAFCDERAPPPLLCRTGWRLDYYVRRAVGCVTFCWSRSFHEPCNVLNEWRGWGDTSQPVCITVQHVLLVRRGCTCWPHHAVLGIKHKTTLSWSTVVSFTLLEKHRRGVGYLQDLYWSRFTSWGDLEQMIRSSVGQWSRSVILIWKTLPWKELRRWLGSFAGSDQRNQILVLLIWL